MFWPRSIIPSIQPVSEIQYQIWSELLNALHIAVFTCCPFMPYSSKIQTLTANTRLFEFADALKLCTYKFRKYVYMFLTCMLLLGWSIAYLLEHRMLDVLYSNEFYVVLLMNIIFIILHKMYSFNLSVKVSFNKVILVLIL